MSNSLSLLKPFSLLFSIAFVMVSPSLAKPPMVHDDIGKTLNVARKKDKMGIFILGTTTCSQCRSLKKYIDAGEVSITSDSFVMADFDANDPEVIATFFNHFSLNRNVERKIPYVVITNPSGKVLVTWTGGKKAPAVEKMVQEAKDKAGSKS
jgi:thioredoxin-related protein